MDTYLCVDIGTSSIKVLEKTGNGTAVRWGILERRGRPFHTIIQPLDIDDAARNLILLLKTMGTSASDAVASVPGFLALKAIAEVPAPGFIPAPAGTFAMSAVRMDDGKYFLAAIPNAVAEKYAEMFNRAGLRLNAVTLESSALAKELGNGADRTLIVDVGDRATTFTVARDGLVEYFAHTDFAAASGAPNVIMEKAEKIASDFRIKGIVLCGGGASLLASYGETALNPLLTVVNGL